MDFFIPPKLPIAPPQALKPISTTVTSAGQKLLTTGVPCIGVWLQSSSKDDSNASMSGIVYVAKEAVTGDGTFIKCEELLTGQATWVPCANTNEIKVITQTGTGWIRGYAVPVQPN
jgi:hypothetical protein